MENKLPEFNGKPLIDIPKSIPTANFLEGDFGKAVLEEYKGRVKSDYNSNHFLNVLSYDDGVVKGSNDFAVVLINYILNQEGLKTASQSDLEKIIKLNALDLPGFYEDSALVLRNTDNPNKYLAGNLMKQIKKRNKKQKMPVMIPLTEFQLTNDSNSDYGLAFKLKENAEIIYAPILNKEYGNFHSKDINEKTGLPKKLGNGNRTLYIGNSGLCGFYLYWDLILDSGYDLLSGSNSDGRVVIKTGEAGALNFANERNNAYQKQLKELAAKKEKALAILNE